MAKRNNPKREARISKNNRNLNWALSLFTLGFVAEYYLLMINNSFVKGPVSQVAAMSYFLEVVAYVGYAMIVAGALLLWKGKEKLKMAGKWLLGLGLFFGPSSSLVLTIYPEGTTFMCILVPVLMMLSVVFLLYPREFFVQAMALSVTIAMTVALGRSASLPMMVLLIKLASYASLLLFALGGFLLFKLSKNEGKLGKFEIFPAKMDYRLSLAVMVFSFAAVVLSMFAGLAYYMTWAAAAAVFALAVYYTAKMM